MNYGDVITLFLHGEIGSSENLFSTGDKLFSYQTCIAERVKYCDMNWNLLINDNYFSKTSSKHRNTLLDAVPRVSYKWGYNVIHVNGEKNCKTLKK